MTVDSVSGEPAVPAESNVVRIAILGDSTVCNFDPAKSELRGWGQVLPDYFMRPQVEVINCALSGRSSKSFILEGHWQKVLKLSPAPNYIFIQFAANDIIGKGPLRETLPGEVPVQLPAEGVGSDPKDWYRNNIRTYIEQSRSIGAIPIMVTSMERPQFRDAVPLRKTLPYAEAAITVAKQMNVAVIDLGAYSCAVYSKLGLQGCDFMHVYKNGKIESHYCEAGARVWAEFIIEQLAKSTPGLKPFIALPAQKVIDQKLHPAESGGK
jgi:pectinesterase